MGGLLTRKETAVRSQVLRSTKGALLERPLTFETILILGVVPQEANSDLQRDVFPCILRYVSGFGEDIVVESLGPEGSIARIAAKEFNNDSMYRALSEIGDYFDVLIYSSNPDWAAVATANDRVVVFGGVEAVIEELLRQCGGPERIWSAAKSTLRGPAFSEPFWASQTSAILNYAPNDDSRLR